jgi:DNA-binding transcriptional ArsR family regulator
MALSARWLTPLGAALSCVWLPYGISMPAISKHLKVLEEAGLIFRRKEGRTNYCSLATAPLGEIDSWLARFRESKSKVIN